MSLFSLVTVACICWCFCIDVLQRLCYADYEKATGKDVKRYAICPCISSQVKGLFFAEKYGQLMAFLMISICEVDRRYGKSLVVMFYSFFSSLLAQNISIQLFARNKLRASALNYTAVFDDNHLITHHNYCQTMHDSSLSPPYAKILHVLLYISIIKSCTFRSLRVENADVASFNSIMADSSDTTRIIPTCCHSTPGKRSFCSPTFVRRPCINF